MGGPLPTPAGARQMCGRYTLTKTHPELQARFDFKAGGFDWLPRYNIAPTQPVLAILDDGQRHAELLHWGLIPSWARDRSIGSRMINARAETVAEKPSFRGAMRSRRCLVLADGYYEWRKEAGRRVPMHITLKTGEAFAFAGLWETWRATSGELVRSCTVVTTAANSFTQPIHDRMPVILPRDAEGTWLDPRAERASALTGLLRPYAAGEMKAHPVSTLVNSPKNDMPECIVPAG